MVIALDPALESAQNELARQRGVAPETLALTALRERFLPSASHIQATRRVGTALTRSRLGLWHLSTRCDPQQGCTVRLMAYLFIV